MPGTVYVVFRGSQHREDWVSNFDTEPEVFARAAVGIYGDEDDADFLDTLNLNAELIHLPQSLCGKWMSSALRCCLRRPLTTEAFFDVTYHRGFLRRSLGAARALRDVLLDEAGKVTRIVVTGHSLGAGQASVFGSLLARGVMTFVDPSIQIEVRGWATPPVLVSQFPLARDGDRTGEIQYQNYLKGLVSSAALTEKNSKHFLIGSDMAPRVGVVFLEVLKLKTRVPEEEAAPLVHKIMSFLTAMALSQFETAPKDGDDNSFPRFEPRHMIHAGGEFLLFEADHILTPGAGVRVCDLLAMLAGAGGCLPAEPGPWCPNPAVVNLRHDCQVNADDEDGKKTLSLHDTLSRLSINDELYHSDHVAEAFRTVFRKFVCDDLVLF